MSFPRNNVGSCTAPSNNDTNNNIQGQQAENMACGRKYEPVLRTSSAMRVTNSGMVRPGKIFIQKRKAWAARSATICSVQVHTAEMIIRLGRDSSSGGF